MYLIFKKTGIFHLTCGFSGMILMIGKPTNGIQSFRFPGSPFFANKHVVGGFNSSEKMLVKLDHFPTGRVKRTNIWNHPKNSPMRFNAQWPSNAICSSPERLAATPRCKVTWWSIWHDVMVAWWILVVSSYITIHPWKLTCALKRDYFNRKYIIRPLIFFRGLNTRWLKSNGVFPFER